MDIVRVFRARVVDLAPNSLIIEITGAEDKIDALVEVLRPFGIVEMVRTGQVVMTRGSAERARAEQGAAVWACAMHRRFRQLHIPSERREIYEQHRNSKPKGAGEWP